MQGNEQEKSQSEQPVNLSDLKNIEFGPDWSAPDRKSRGKDAPSQKRTSSPESKQKKTGAHDRRKRANQAPEKSSGERPKPRASKAKEDVPKIPQLNIAFYPKDVAFDKLTDFMRRNCKTYELFEIAKLILEKPERFLVHLKQEQDKKGDNAAASKPPNPTIYVCEPDGMPFLSEEAALHHALIEHHEIICNKETLETEPPKGNFPFVHKCPYTGTLIAPPNYHRYNQLLREHHAARVEHLSLTEYAKKLEKVTDQESIDAWMEKMKTQTIYKFKEPQADEEAQPIYGIESLKTALKKEQKTKLVQPRNSTRFPAEKIPHIKDKRLKQTIEELWRQQQEFPLDTANNLRGRLRRMKFHIYKREDKNISYVSAVKPKQREPNASISDRILTLLKYLEEHPGTQKSLLPDAYLNLDIQSAQPNNEATNESEAGSENTETEPHAKTRFENAPPEVQQSIRAVLQDLKWLVQEGYVTEFVDGKLYAQPIGPGYEKKNQNATEEKADAPTQSGSDPVPPADNAELASSAGQNDADEQHDSSGNSQ